MLFSTEKITAVGPKTRTGCKGGELVGYMLNDLFGFIFPPHEISFWLAFHYAVLFSSCYKPRSLATPDVFCFMYGIGVSLAYSPIVINNLPPIKKKYTNFGL